MALVKGTNSYVTLAEAELYFADRLNAASWLASDDSTKSQALIMATTMLDMLDWSGALIDTAQLLAFPRDSEYFDTRLGISVTSMSAVPNRILTATFEQAHHLLNNDDLLNNTGMIKNLSVGSVNLSTIQPASKIPVMVKRLIQPLLNFTSSTGSWWRAN